MSVTCKNCQHKSKGNYCPQCGQSTHTHEINFKFLWHDIQHGLLHFDKGMFYTIPQLYRNPGRTVQHYMEGKRVRHSKPFTLVFLLASLFILEKHLLHLHIDINVNVNDHDFSEWIFNHFSISAIAMLPLLALWSWLLFRKQGNNYIEHLVLNAYLTSQSLAFYIVLMPLFKASHYVKLDEMFSNIGVLVYPLVLMWGYITFFTSYKKLTTVVKSLLCVLLTLIALIFVLMAVAILFSMFRIM